MALFLIKLVPLIAVLWLVGRTLGQRALVYSAGPVLCLFVTVAAMRLALAVGGPGGLLWILLPLAGMARMASRFGPGAPSVR